MLPVAKWAAVSLGLQIRFVMFIGRLIGSPQWLLARTRTVGRSGQDAMKGDSNVIERDSRVAL